MNVCAADFTELLWIIEFTFFLKESSVHSNRLEQWDRHIPVIHGDFKDNTQYLSYIHNDGSRLLVVFVSVFQTVDLSYTVEAKEQKL